MTLGRFESVVCHAPKFWLTIVGPGQAATVPNAPTVADVLVQLQPVVPVKYASPANLASELEFKILESCLVLNLKQWIW